ncbi:four-carbon acid sugar kinase family protein [Variovorax ureilyticus]|uniref:Four-carbon acid sugar kinase family protein n=1 Tax=Variovorax ureilyticus TaxID=1836198 RepID=A0ABU8VPI3_9BURK
MVAFYGDDFTGSSAAMEVLAFAGLETVLFLAPPSAERLAAFSGYRGIGIAGIARARSPEWMNVHLPPIFSRLREVGAPIVHYKVCSTFDSAPHIGSIGRAAEIGRQYFEGWTPLVVSDPGMGRFQAFGNLFAHSNGVGFRLDRHPTMSVHPSTPMDEADLGRHLARQTDRRIGLVDFVTMKRGGATKMLEDEIAGGAEIISLDVLDAETLVEAGRLMWKKGATPLFAVGSQGVEQALIAYWRSAGLLTVCRSTPGFTAAENIAAVSGSVSPVTAAQISHAEANGFELIRLNAALATDASRLAKEVVRVSQLAKAALAGGRSPLVFTAAGPQDPAVEAFRAAVAASKTPLSTVNDHLGAALGDILKRLISETGVRRVVISGGDTSGQAALRLGIDALTAIAPMAPGAPLCRAHSSVPAIDGLELILKGGQTGAPDFFAAVRAGRQ